MGRSAIIGNHLYFLPEGKTIDLVTVSSTAKPDDDPATNWTDYKLTCITDANVENSANPVNVRAPIDDVGGGVPGGVYQAKDQIAREQNLEIVLTCAEINPTVWQVIWMTDEILSASTGVFVPFAKSGLLKGWARLAQYDHDNTKVSSVDMWCSMHLDGQVNFSEEDVTRTRLRLKVLQNSLNTGNLLSFF